mgnify:CR=1 FL=1
MFFDGDPKKGVDQITQKRFDMETMQLEPNFKRTPFESSLQNI